MKGTHGRTRGDNMSEAIANKVRCRAVVECITSGQNSLLDEGME